MGVIPSEVICSKEERTVRKRNITIVALASMALLAGSAVGVLAQDEVADPMRPATFRFGFAGDASEVVDATVTKTELGSSSRGFAVIDIPVKAGDSRASGLLTSVQNEERAGRVVVISADVRIVNDAGTWSGPASGVLRLKKNPPGNGPDINRAMSIATLTGDGAYEGLTLILAQTLDEWLGYIVPTDLLPPAPDLPVQTPAE